MNKVIETYLAIQNYNDNLYITTKGFDVSYTSDVKNAMKFNKPQDIRDFIGTNLDESFKYRIVKVEITDTLIKLDIINE